MHIEIDQSGRVEFLIHDTALAFTNAVSYGILIPRKEKRAVFTTLKQSSPSLAHPEVRVFSVAVFLLIRDHLKQLEHLTIDPEYSSHETDIKGILLRNIRKVKPKFDKYSISFASIGKHSLAHFKAYGIFSGKQQPDRTVRAAEILSLL